MAIAIYAPPKEQAVLNQVIRNVRFCPVQTSNLAFLVLPLEKRNPFAGKNTNVIAQCWKSICCDVASGEYVNPHTPHKGRRVADLLAQPPSIFLEWAQHSTAVSQLPLTHSMPNWISVARKRLKLCQLHPEDELIPVDSDIQDLSDAQSLLDRFRPGAGHCRTH